MLATPIQFIRSLKGTDFTAGLAQGFGTAAELPDLENNQGSVNSLVILSDQNLAWSLLFFATTGGADPDLDLDTYLGRIDFAAEDGVQLDAAGAYRYDASGLDIPYRDDDALGILHVVLMNRSATAKNAGATGEVVTVIGYRPGSWS